MLLRTVISRRLTPINTDCGRDYQRRAPAFSLNSSAACFLALLLLGAEPIRAVGPAAVLWTAPSLLFASMLIAWGAESAQFFIAQGFALAILAWMQTLPEFAVEAVLAWKQQTAFLLANLTGALRLLTGLGWPMIYCAAAVFHRRKTGRPLGCIRLDREHSVNVAGLLAALVYMSFVLAKGSLTLIDSAVLIGIYAAYLAILRRIPPESEEGIEDLETIPRAIVLAPRRRRILLITLCFVVGGALIYFVAEPFLGSLLALSMFLTIPSFLFIQWVAPFVSEFPEMLSTFYFARTVTRAPMALMNMVSSNINQWTLLAAMLPIVYSLSRGSASSILFDDQQKLELLMTIGQALVGMMFLVNMELSWWEAAVLFVLWVVQFGFSAMPSGAPGVWSYLGHHVHGWITATYFVWAAWELVRLLTGARRATAVFEFARMWREHVVRRG
jgi:cation:H+ antiporter